MAYMYIDQAVPVCTTYYQFYKYVGQMLTKGVRMRLLVTVD